MTATTVYTTAGGLRFHATLSCRALESGRTLSEVDCGCYEFCTHRLPTTHLPRKRDSVSAVREGFTACRVCVPPALALPATGQTHGHEPVNMWPNGLVCARCYTETRHAAYDEPDDVEPEQWTDLHAVPWPCMSAVVLGLVQPTGGDR